MTAAEDLETDALAASLARYGADRWGKEFLSASEAGHLLFTPPGHTPVDLHELTSRLVTGGLTTPLVVRFPAVIEARMRRLRRAFAEACAENHYEGAYIGVYPVKVNPRRTVVEAVTRVRRELGFGLEAGSKPELLLLMTQEPVDGLPLLINGFKDREFMRLAFHASELGHEVVVVLESIRELRRYLEVNTERTWASAPALGMRAKLYSRGQGRWQSSGGELSKFGLTTGELLQVVRTLQGIGLVNRLTLLHFHIGSQITEIKRIKTAVREGARVWCHLRAQVPEMRYLDLGGGIGVDYDGSHSSNPCSANYNIEEYANQVVFEVSEACRDFELEEPTIITESGRALVAHHAVTITDLREVQGELLPVPEPSEEEHRIIAELRHTLKAIDTSNFAEYFHDALDFRDEALQLFSRGYIDLHDRAAAEALFHRVRSRCEEIVEDVSIPPSEIVQYLRQARLKYLANFSIFQSIPDFWSVDQLFPVAPLSHHAEQPRHRAQIVDITCDSDGRVDAFAHPERTLAELPLHLGMGEEGEEPSPQEAYYLGFFMTGAYQDSLANCHNLFGRCNEAVVHHERARGANGSAPRVPFDEHYELEVVAGMNNGALLESMGYRVADLESKLVMRTGGREPCLDPSWTADQLMRYPYLLR